MQSNRRSLAQIRMERSFPVLNRPLSLSLSLLDRSVRIFLSSPLDSTQCERCTIQPGDVLSRFTAGIPPLKRFEAMLHLEHCNTRHWFDGLLEPRPAHQCAATAHKLDRHGSLSARRSQHQAFSVKFSCKATTFDSSALIADRRISWTCSSNCKYGSRTFARCFLERLKIERAFRASPNVWFVIESEITFRILEKFWKTPQISTDFHEILQNSTKFYKNIT